MEEPSSRPSLDPSACSDPPFIACQTADRVFGAVSPAADRILRQRRHGAHARRERARGRASGRAVRTETRTD